MHEEAAQQAQRAGDYAREIREQEMVQEQRAAGDLERRRVARAVAALAALAALDG